MRSPRPRSSPGNLPRLSRTGIAELDRFAAAFTDLSRSIINTSTRFQRIIDMASVELAGYELREGAPVYTTDNFFFHARPQRAGGRAVAARF